MSKRKRRVVWKNGRIRIVRNAEYRPIIWTIEDVGYDAMQEEAWERSKLLDKTETPAPWQLRTLQLLVIELAETLHRRSRRRARAERAVGR